MQFGMYITLSAIMFRLRISCRQYVQPLPWSHLARAIGDDEQPAPPALTDGCSDGSFRNQ